VKSALPLLAALAAGLLSLSACQPPATPTPGARPVATVPVSTSVPVATTVPAAPTAVLASPDPAPSAAWTEHPTEALSIRLPANWLTVEPDAEVERLSAFQQKNPELAGFLGGAGPLTEVAFSAQDESGAAESLANNLNIRRTALDGQGGESLPEIAATISAQYRQLGFEVAETIPRVEIGGLPAARLVYTFSIAGQDGAMTALSGLQVLVAAPADLWILTYTAQSDRFAALRPVFEESARSFRVR